MVPDHPSRLHRTASAVVERDLGALLVTPSADLRWLVGYRPPPLERLTCLVLRPEGPSVLVVPALERPLAEASSAGRLVEIAAWDETDDPYALVGRIVGGDGPVACSDRMWATHLLRLQAAMGDRAFVSATPILGPLRAVKDGQELALLERAARYADEAFGRLVATRLETLNEREVAGRVAELLVQIGHDDVAFTIVGAGPNGASPHHEPGDRELHAGDAVVLDFGGRTGGYCSDLSRTVAVVESPRGFEAVYEVVREAQEAAFRAVRPGVPAEEVDRVARTVISDAGYGELFIHRTGHGIGLEEHEAPYIVAGNEEPLRPGMCFSIEPGIYLPGAFGVRIEDVVAVTDDGAERLNRASRDLEIVR
ncbi:MAG TPA: Xaa-Pro peptidase family protein [Actinomycetota bacterium]|nr:Xaa-Pro peptidase family protein [Actinomycetota bacterium]